MIPLKIIYTLQELAEWRQSLKNQPVTMGFVPTMGALHLGHISLINRALEECDVVIASIFVNPTQFNDPHDFLHYPKNNAADLEMLKDYPSVVVFMPSTTEMYPSIEKEVFNAGLLTSTLEAKLRPGHFDGVITIIRKLFDAVEAHKVYFGEKDFQQLAVIKAWVAKEARKEIIVPCPTIREKDGLAMSSRNLRLSAEQRALAPLIFQTLQEVQLQMAYQNPAELEVWARSVLHNHPAFKLDYFEIIDGNSFAPLAEWQDSTLPVALLAAFMGDVRLIDNLPLTAQSI